MMRYFLAVTLLSLQAWSLCTLQIKTDGVIGPASLDYLERALERASTHGCDSILYLINTPGGSLQTTRLIVEKIVNSPIPILCLVHPSGGHAGSAGAIILQACHVNGASPATNIGAATPVTMGGELGDDMKKKVINDTVSWLEGLADLRGRNRQFVKDIVIQAKAVDSKEALKLNAIDSVSGSVEEFLDFSKERMVPITGSEKIKVKVGEVIEFDPDTRFSLLDFLTHPQVAYLIFMGSLALLYFEITHPGMIAPGVIGALGLVISLLSFHMLDVRWGALILILLGLGFMIAEVFVASFGALGIGGILSFVAGSILLFDPEVGSLPLMTVIPSAVFLSALMMGIGFLALRAGRRTNTLHPLVGELGVVTEVQEGNRVGQLEVHGEIWNFESVTPIELKTQVRIEKIEGLKLNVKALKE